MTKAKRILSVVMLGLLMIPGAMAAYPAGEQPEAGAGDNPDGMIACPVVGEPDTHSALQRLATEPLQLQPQPPMSPVTSCGQPPDVLAQYPPMGNICRFIGMDGGEYWCALRRMRPLGANCCCYGNAGRICGWVSDY